LFNNDAIIINGGDVGKLFVLINAGVVHSFSKKLIENKSNPFWKYPANQSNCFKGCGICLIEKLRCKSKFLLSVVNKINI